MSKMITYIAVLIGLFLVVVYYKGFSKDITAGGSAINNLVLFLQGRNSQGQITDYPK